MKVAYVLLSAALVMLAACGSTVDVAGQTMYQGNEGAPFPGVKVKIGNRPLVTTDSDGSFQVRDVSVPYDLIAVAPDGSAAEIFVGLRRKDPTILVTIPGGTPAPLRRGVVAGRFSTPGPSQHSIGVSLVTPPTAHALVTAASVDVQNGYSLTVEWRGNPNLRGTLTALQWLGDADGTAHSYDASGSVPATLTDGTSSPGGDLNLTSVRNTRLTGTISLPPGYQLHGHELYASFSPGLGFSLGKTAFTADPRFDYAGFVGPPVQVGVRVFAGSPAGDVRAWRVAPGSGDSMQITVPAAPVILAPDRQTSVSIGTTFSWSAVPGAVYQFRMHAVTPTAIGPALDVITGATSFRLPDLSGMGFTWPKPAVSTVFLVAIAPRVPDDIAGWEYEPPEDRDGVDASAPTAVFDASP